MPEPADTPDAAPTAPAPPPAARVRATGLGHRFPGTDDLFTGLDFELVPGEVVAVCGPSGCGKSTLLSILAGWLAPARGTVEATGIGRTSWVFQNPYGVARRTALDHAVLPLLARGWRRADAERRAAEVLAEFRLAEAAHRPFRELSGGEAQRLMLARSVCTAPDLLLVDEPTAQLDRRTAATVNASLDAIGRAGTIVVIATHDPHTRAACTRVLDLGPPVPEPGDAA
ncbi:ATP-binding cassette domain-containing protein [Nocardiopsis trehalosi]|uniref:ATP-binding cassette domain-containing protein n=1 Tax=Nocardiopsis trehalosi TaxID=109329 RepID=UPI000A03D130|nr:ATP-binding cassette domain-containing protein [Nocardiopsis trehalosi]